MDNSTCTFTECNRPSRARGYCGAHYKQWLKGDGLYEVGSRSIKRTLEEKIEASTIRKDGCWDWAGKLDKHGYPVIWRYDGTQLVHRIRWEILHGELSPNTILDHICRNLLCTNPEHLRPVTRKQNSENRSGASRNNKSTGVLGVSYIKSKGKYRACVRSMGKTLYCKEFRTLGEAEAAVIEARNRHFTHNDVDRVKA